MINESFTNGFYEEIISNLNEYIFEVVFKDNLIVSSYHSPQLESLWGYSQKDFDYSWDNWIAKVHEHDRAYVQQAYLESYDGVLTKRCLEYRIVHKEGTILWVQNRCAAKHDSEKGTVAIVGFLIDITEQKKKDLRLRHLEQVVEQAPVAVVVTDLDGVVEHVNSYCSTITGYSEEELIGSHTKIFNSGTKPDSFYDELWKTIKSGKTWSGEFLNHGKEGRIFHERASISPLRNDSGEVVSYIAVKEDITKEKINQLKMVEKEQELQHTNEKYLFELKQARRLQRALMPKEFPQSDFLRCESFFSPMDEVGGDFFAFSEHLDDSISIFVADVSGHGVTAALYLTLIKHIAERTIQRQWNMPDRVLESINRELHESMETNFITAIYGYFTPYPEKECVSFHFANGGHTKTVVHFKKENVFKTFNIYGTLIGLFHDIEFGSSTITLHSGDRVYIFTDGVVELTNPAEKMLGYNGLIEWLTETSDMQLPDVMEHIKKNMDGYLEGAHPNDDVLLTVVEIK